MNESLPWLKQMSLDAADEPLRVMARMFATFYLALIDYGIPADHAVSMTQAYIDATVANTAAQAQEAGGAPPDGD